MRMRFRKVPLYLALLAVGGCVDSCERVDYVSVSPYRPNCLLVGDSTFLVAEAWNRGFGGLLYTSDEAPSRFRWASTAPGVARVSNGEVFGLQLGDATIEASAEGVTGSHPISVEKPVGALKILLSRTDARVGDTIEVTVEATDTLGQLLTGARVRSYPLVGGLTMLPWPMGDTAMPTPYKYLIRGDFAGDAAIGAQWFCLNRQPVFSDTTFQVAP